MISRDVVSCSYFEGKRKYIARKCEKLTKLIKGFVVKNRNFQMCPKIIFQD